MSIDLNLEPLEATIGAGALIVNDYALNITQIEHGYRLAVTRGSETQTMDVLDGVGIIGIEKTGSTGDMDSYRVSFTDGSTFEYTVETNAASNAAAEAARAEAENSRVSAEAERVSAEAGRVNAEDARVTSEAAREAAESARASAESDRAQAEDGRQSAEAARVTDEQNRASAESGRVAAENARVAAEDARVSAENTRAETFAGYENRIVESERTAQSVRDDADAGKFNGKDAPQESVLYTAQTLTDVQKAQARENIAAVDVARVEAVETALGGKLDNMPGTWPVWTADEQAAARERMNAQGSYKHIATITIDEDGVYNVGIDRDENGMVFSVSDVFIYGYIKKTGGNVSTSVAINTITTSLNGSNNIIKLPANYNLYGAQFELNIKKSKYWRAYAVSSTGVNDPNINGVTGSTTVSHRGASNVRNNEWETLTALAFATEDTAFGIGTTFDIWGR